ncbi:VanZ family protein [Streptomyces sp. bgisy084]|uniref:VanZ family protein n=1 Tax=Streptomyces sp. bgisy084 TaxID=3413777 RepID=UPI003D72AC3A
MIEASIGALPGLISAVLVTAVLLGVPSAMVAKARGQSVSLALLFAVALAGVLTVTLMPGGGGSGQAGICDVGLPYGAFLTSESARLNVLLFVPVSCFAVLLFRRPVMTLAGTLALTCGIEWVQSWTDMGRACSYDDIKANSLGGILGVALGIAGLWVHKRRPPFSRKDLVWGAGAGALGALLLTASFAIAVKPVHGEEETQRLRARAADMLEQDAWMERTVAELYGKEARATRSSSEKLKDGHWRLTVETSRGTVVARWPDRKLEFLRPKSGESGTGSLSVAERRAAGERFAKKWFPREVAGAKATATALHGKHGPFVLTYRRYMKGVMMPMRLDLSVSSAGRVLSMAARSTQDPKLPEATVTKAAAKKQAERGAGSSVANPVKLLAQRVDHAWRPVWMVALAPGPQQRAESTVFIDAVTGDQVTPEPVEAGNAQN